MIRPDIREAEFLPFRTSGKTRNGIIVGGDLEFVRFDYLSSGNLADILQAHSAYRSITAEKWFLFEKDQGTRRRNRSISAFFGRNGRAFQLTRLISSEAGIDGNNDESESFDIKARVSQVVKKAALEGFLILSPAVVSSLGFGRSSSKCPVR